MRKEDTTFIRPAHTEEALPGLDSLAEGLTGRIVVDCCVPEYLSTFHCTFFTRFSALKNAFKTSFFQYKTAICFESPSAVLDSLAIFVAISFDHQ
jgi:hypothetical protein